MEQQHQRFLLGLFYAVLGGVTAFLLLPWLLPFLLALGLAALLEPLVVASMRYLHLSRCSSAALCTALFVGLLLTLCAVVLVRGAFEVSVLLTRLPQLLDALPNWKGSLEGMLYRLVVAAPIPLQDFLRQATDSLIAQGVTVPGALYAWLMDTLGALTAAAPGALLLVFTTFFATYFSSAYRHSLLGFLRRQLPSKLRPKLRSIRVQLGYALGGWLKAQGILLLVTFSVLTVALLLMGIDFALLIAAGTALLDALPIFGTGAVLLPWAVISFFTGHTARALSLALLYGILWLIRSVLEPKLVGDRVGLPPLAALVAMYGGFHFFGVGGMILAPLVAIILKQLHDCGLFRLWRD